MRNAICLFFLAACTTDELVTVAPEAPPTLENHLHRTYVAPLDLADDFVGASPFLDLDLAFSIRPDLDGAPALVGTLMSEGEQVCATPYEVGSVELADGVVSAEGDLFVEVYTGDRLGSAVFEQVSVDAILGADGRLEDVRIDSLVDLRRNPAIDASLRIVLGSSWCASVFGDCEPCADGAPVCQRSVMRFDALEPWDSALQSTAVRAECD